MFARTFLSLRSFFSSTAKNNLVNSALAHLNFKREEEIAHPANKLFKHYIIAVVLFFVIGSVAPINAYSSHLDSSFILDNSQSPFISDQDGYLTKINPQTDIGDRSTMSDYLTHTVAKGDTLSTIASYYDLKVETLIWSNDIANANSLRVGQTLSIPPVNGVNHQIKKDEDLTKIAKNYSVTPEAILKQNDLSIENTLTVGANLFIPGAKPLVDPSIARNTTARIATSSRIDATPLVGGSATPIAGKPFVFPTRGKITQYFHPGHYAYDIGNPDRPAVWAAGAGTITKVVNNCANVSYRCGNGYGNHVIIQHDNGMQTLYAHLTYASVTVGDKVGQNDVIGKMGRSGNAYGATGIHLHFEVINADGIKIVPNKVVSL